MPAISDAICLLGGHEPDYPRNRSVRRALEAAGFTVLIAHSRAPFPWRHLILAWKYLRVFRKVRWVFVTEGGHRLVPMIKIMAALTGRKVAFDPFLSRYNTRIEDRRLHAPSGLQALICRWQDWSSTHAADLLFFDTQEHRDYFYRNYRLAKPFAVLPVGVPEDLFRPVDPSAVPSPYRRDRETFEVLFYGSYIPLQGAEWIVEAAALIREEGLRFTLIGEGQTFAETTARARALGVTNVDFLPRMAEADLIPYLAHADLCLGIFGATLKAAQVVPNKVVQAAAMGKAMITRASPAMGRYFSDGLDAALIPAADPQALARRILALRADPALRRSLGKRARETFEREFSVTALSRLLGNTLGRPPVVPGT